MAKLTLTQTTKFRRLCARLRLESRAHVVGHLEELWNTCHSRKSPVVGDLDDIEAAADWPPTRPSHQLATALIELGFLDEIVPGRVYAVHDYYDHAPRWIKQHFSKLRQEDVTVGPETYFLGIDAFGRLFEDPDAIVQGEIRTPPARLVATPAAPQSEPEDDLEEAQKGAVDEASDPAPDPPAGGRKPSPPGDKSTKPRDKSASTSQTAKRPGTYLDLQTLKVSLSSLVLSKSSTPPPSSPPSPPPLDPAAELRLRAAIARAAQAEAALGLAGSEEVAQQIAEVVDLAGDDVDTWTELAEILEQFAAGGPDDPPRQEAYRIQRAWSHGRGGPDLHVETEVAP